MIIDLRELLEPRGRVEGDVETRVEDPVAGELAVPCHVAVDYRQSQGVFYFHGAVDATLAGVCHRCLEPVSSRMGGEFDVMARRGEASGVEGDDVITLAAHEHEVRLDALVHETVVVNTPMVVLCREDCKGLCPTCGANLNTAPCDCSAPADSRWDALRKLKSE